MEYRRLGNTDMIVSSMSLGASAFNNFYMDSNFDNSAESLQQVKAIVDAAFDAGINYFDVAPWYGNAQPLLAYGLSDRPRDSYYLATKVGRYNSDKPVQKWIDFSYKRTIESVEESLRLFGCGYIDLIQVHDFELAADINQIVTETLPALADLQKQGKVRYIGINSYSITKLKELLELSTTKIDTVLTFTHLCLDDASLLDHVDYFRSKGVGVINASPLSMGMFTEVGAPKWHNAPEHVKLAARQAYEYCKARDVNLSKLAFHFSATNKTVDTTIVSMSTQQLVHDNVSYLNELSDKEKALLVEVETKFFRPLQYTGFGDVEVEKYWRKMNNQTTHED